MKETPQQYTERILGYIKGKQPLDVLSATANKLDRLIKGRSTAELRESIAYAIRENGSDNVCIQPLDGSAGHPITGFN